MLVAQGNIATTHHMLGRFEPALEMYRDVYSGRVNLNGEEHLETLRAAYNYALSLIDLQRFEEAKVLLRRTVPVAQRVLGADNQLTIRMRSIYARALYMDPAATLDDLREAVMTLEETTCIARRVLGGAHPLTEVTETGLQDARATLRARETPSTSA